MESLDYKKIIVDENKPWMVFIHGLFDSIEGFYKTVNCIKKDNSHNILLLSLPGHGNDRNRKHITFQDSVLELADIINSHCSVCHIVGFSMGGRFATLISSLLKIKIKSLILIDISLSPSKNAFKVLNDALSTYINQTFLSEKAKETLKKNNKFLSDLSFRQIDERTWEWNLNTKIVLSWLEEIKDKDFFCYWDSLEIPKLVLFSTKSKYLNYSDIQIYKKGGQVVSFNGGHALHKSYPLEVSNRILNFVKDKKMNILFRDWKKNDTEYLLNLIDTEEEAYHVLPSANYPLEEENLNAILKERASVTVSEIDETIIGLASIYGINEGTAFLGSVVIDKKYRGQNCGQRMIDYVINDSKIKFNLNEIHVSCFSDNTLGLLFYNTLGFVPYGLKVKIDKYSKKHILIHLKRTLE